MTTSANFNEMEETLYERFFKHKTAQRFNCEPHYVITPYVAEFLNTLSSLDFFVVGILYIYLYRDYAQLINPTIQRFWRALVLIGVSSVYYHATLNSFGEFLYNFSMIWTYMTGIYLYVLSKYFPWTHRLLREDMFSTSFYLSWFVAAVAFVRPEINTLILLTFGFLPILVFFKELKKIEFSRVFVLTLLYTWTWIMAMFFWINDYWFCETLWAERFPFFHAFWHMSLCMSLTYGNVLVSYFVVRPKCIVALNYWPNNRYEIGFPYVAVLRSNIPETYLTD